MPLQMLTPKQGAKLLGVSESTVRRWCDSGDLSTSRTSGGHRRIEVNTLLAFARGRGLTVVSMAPAATAGQGGRLSNDQELANRLYEQLVTASSEGRASDFAQDLVAELGEVTTLCDQIITPALHRIGNEWSSETLRIHQEHMATQECLAAVLAARSHVGVPEAEHVAICASLENDPYALAPAMCSLALRSAGMRSILLGPNTPGPEVLRAAVEHGAALIAVSVSVTPSSARELDEICSEADAAGIRVALGGRGLTVGLRKELTPDFFGDNMAHLVAYATRLVRTLRDAGA